jgi:NitT/TauT family transport system substrate-binding protein
MKYKYLLTPLLGILLVVGGCGKSAKKYRVGTWKTAQTIQPFFYAEVGKVSVDVFAFTNPADQKTALLSGSLDMCGTTIAHAIHSSVRGEPVVLIAGLCNKCSALVVNKKIKSVKELKGKTIGYVPGTMHEILLRELLTKNGINPSSDVKLTRVDFFDMGTALAKGSIDAFLSGEPFPTMAQKKGYGYILAYPYFEDSVGKINAGMLVKRSDLKKNRKMVLDLVKAHVKATRHLNKNKKIWLTRAASFGTDYKILELASPNMEIFWNIDEKWVKQVKELGERMQKLGIINKQPDYSALIDLSIVKEVRKELGL